MKRSCFVILLITIVFSLSACVGNTEGSHTEETRTTPEASTSSNASIRTENNGVKNPQNNPEASIPTPQTSKQVGGRTNEIDQYDNSTESLAMSKIRIQIGEQTFYATLYNNPSTNGLIKLLPLTLNMQELNGNEKYFYFSEDLPSDSARVDEIQTGDLMLYGSDCLVLFYNSFSTSYRYTRLGRIEDITGLVEALGTGSVSVKIDIEK